MDFGVAQLEDRASITVDGDLVGTLAYMSPEQLEGRNIDSRSDVYSLALTLYEGFTRRNPSKGKKLQELLRDVSRPEIPPLSVNRPDLPVELSDALGRAMVRDSYARPDAEALGRLLSAAAETHAPVEIPEERLATRVRERLVPARMDRERVAYSASISRLGPSPCAASCIFCLEPPSIRRWRYAAIIVPAFAALMWPFGGAIPPWPCSRPRSSRSGWAGGWCMRCRPP